MSKYNELVSRAIMLSSKMSEESNLEKLIKLNASLNLLTIASTLDRNDPNYRRLINLSRKL